MDSEKVKYLRIDLNRTSRMSYIKRVNDVHDSLRIVIKGIAMATRCEVMQYRRAACDRKELQVSKQDSLSNPTGSFWKRSAWSGYFPIT